MAIVAGNTSEARAADGPVDASFGRIQGDVSLIAGAGAVIAPRGPRAEGELRARYLDTVGLFASYEDGPMLGAGADPRRVFGAGLEVRPLFLARWLQGMETRDARWNLALDSLGLELGAIFVQPESASFQSTPGIEVGLGLEIPLFPSATGLWLALHGGLRWSQQALASGVTGSAEDRSAYLTVTLAWHQVVTTHAVDVGDLAPR